METQPKILTAVLNHYKTDYKNTMSVITYTRQRIGSLFKTKRDPDSGYSTDELNRRILEQKHNHREIEVKRKGIESQICNISDLIDYWNNSQKTEDDENYVTDCIKRDHPVAYSVCKNRNN